MLAEGVSKQNLNISVYVSLFVSSEEMGNIIFLAILPKWTFAFLRIYGFKSKLKYFGYLNKHIPIYINSAAGITPDRVIYFDNKYRCAIIYIILNYWPDEVNSFMGKIYFVISPKYTSKDQDTKYLPLHILDKLSIFLLSLLHFRFIMVYFKAQ